MSLLLWLMKIVLIGYRGSSESWVSHLPRVASTLGNANRQPQVLEQGLCSPHPIQALVVDQAVRAGHSHATGRSSSTPEKTGVRTPVARSIRSTGQPSGLRRQRRGVAA